MFILFIITFIDLLGFGILFPLLPMIQMHFQLTVLEIGIMVSTFSIATLFGNIIFGILSDKMGRKTLLVLPPIFMGIFYFLTPFAPNYTILLVIRVLTGFCSGNFSVCFATGCDLSYKETRAKTLGILSVAFGLGFMFGPAIRGLLLGTANISLYIPFVVAGGLSLTSGILAFLLFKETLLKKNPDEKSHNMVEIKQQLRSILKI